jgi:hypothetical protein
MLIVLSGVVSLRTSVAKNGSARRQAGTGGVPIGGRKLNPLSSLWIPKMGARSAIRDTGASGVRRYLWTVTMFDDIPLAQGRSGERVEARSLAEAALTAFVEALRGS